MLNQMLNFHKESIPKDFGFLMTPVNIEDHLAQTQLRRLEWRKTDPELVKLVQDLDTVKGI